MSEDRLIAGLREALAAAIFYQDTKVYPDEWAEDWVTMSPEGRARYRAKADALGEDFIKVAETESKP